MELIENHNRPYFHAKNLRIVILVHILALGFAPFFFTWMRFLVTFGLSMIFCYSMGIFHHMLFTHSSFKCKQWLRNVGATLGTLTWRGPFAGPVQYVAGHRVHHQHADTDLDPHSPIHGIFHAWLGWFWKMPEGLSSFDKYRAYAEDIDSEPYLLWCDQHVDLLQFLWAVVCFGAGCLFSTGGWSAHVQNGLIFVLYGVFVKTLLVWFFANAVDVVNHTIGYRGYETPDHSTNSFLMAAVHMGGAISWHNNHHARADYFTVRRRWWEFDVHHLFLQFLQRFGIVWDIQILDETAQTKALAARS